jgi:SHS2 domain-containing protein
MTGYSYPDGGPPADLLVEGTGKTIGEAFGNVALAMFNAITPLDGVVEKETFTAEADGIDMESLLLNLLSELLFLNDTEGLTAKTIDVEVDAEHFRAKALCRGESFSAATHEAGVSVKAATYHMMSIKHEKSSWVVRAVFDT